MAAKKPKSTPKSFNLLDDADRANRVKESLIKLRKGDPSTVDTLASIRRELLHVPPIYFQAAINSYGLPLKTLIDVIGAEGIGKSTLMFTTMGWAMAAGSPCYYVETEGKMMDPSRIIRCLHPNRVTAKKMFDALNFDQAFELRQAVESIENWVKVCRDPKDPATYVPHHIPLVVGLDTFSKLMAPKEAEGRQLYQDQSVSEGKEQELGGGSNFGHAKLAQSWSRRLPNWLTFNNVILILNRHQNDKVDMNAMPSFLPADAMAGYNKTSIGGRAFSQNAALQLIITRFRYATAKQGQETVKIGVDAKISIAKNSYGPEGASCYYRLNYVYPGDTQEMQTPALSFAPYTPEWLMGRGILDVTSKNKNCFSCRELNLFDVDTTTFTEAVQASEELVKTIGSRLNLRGYELSDQPVPDTLAHVPSEAPDEEVSATAKE